jgi:hypothetical protein
VTAAAGLRMRVERAGYGLVALALLTSGCSKSGAQQPVTAAQCRASVSLIGVKRMCPTAPITFRIAVSGCAHSVGSFDYEFKAVNEIKKATVRMTARWSRTVRAWDQTEYVALACDEEIDDLATEGSAACTCLTD